MPTSTTPNLAQTNPSMRKRIEQWLTGIWYGGRQPPAWLSALSRLYAVAFRLHLKIATSRQPQDLQRRPIVVVGNITAGGSGKTPLVIWLCRALQAAGMNPGVASRGYGRNTRRLVRVTNTTPVTLAGDEPLLIAQQLGIPVVVASDRCSAARELFNLGADIVIADDGLQHHRLPRSTEICVVDGKLGWGNGRLLPSGPMRETRERLARCDYVVTNDTDSDSRDNPWKTPPDNRDRGPVSMHLTPQLLHALDGHDTWRPAQFAGCRVHAVAGIGNPGRFFHALQRAGMHVIEHPFPDHHAFSREDFASFEAGIPIIMTEKDAVKCRGMKLPNAWYLSVDAALPAAFEKDVIERLARQVNSVRPVP